MLSRHCSSFQAQIDILNVFHLYKNIFYFKPFLEKCFYATSNHLLQCRKTFQTPQMSLNHVTLRPQRIQLSVVIPSFFKGILHEKWSTKAFVLHSEHYSSFHPEKNRFLRIRFLASVLNNSNGEGGIVGWTQTKPQKLLFHFRHHLERRARFDDAPNLRKFGERSCCCCCHHNSINWVLFWCIFGVSWVGKMSYTF